MRSSKLPICGFDSCRGRPMKYDFKKVLSLIDESEANIYMYGSRVYGTYIDSSDYDFIIVTKFGDPYKQINYSDINCTIYNRDQFVKLIQQHEISVLECLFLPNKFKLLTLFEYGHSGKIDPKILRSSLSAKASNSFVKAKKKFIVEKDRNFYVGKKSLFHSLRIPIFGEQIGQYGKIVDYSAANYLWNDIINCDSEDWEIYKKKYKPILNKLMSNFRKVAPK